MPPGQTIARLDRHPAEARVACVDDPDRPDLHPGTMALHRMTVLRIVMRRT
jgi:hypothetical protein